MADKITKLSQAIRLGATFRPQCAGQYFLNGASCALGAAMEALGVEPRDENSNNRADRVLERFGVLLKEDGRKGTFYSALGERIYCDNDNGLTREQIADYLEAEGL